MNKEKRLVFDTCEMSSQILKLEKIYKKENKIEKIYYLMLLCVSIPVCYFSGLDIFRAISLSILSVLPVGLMLKEIFSPLIKKLSFAKAIEKDYKMLNLEIVNVLKDKNTQFAIIHYMENMSQYLNQCEVDEKEAGYKKTVVTVINDIKNLLEHCFAHEELEKAAKTIVNKYNMAYLKQALHMISKNTLNKETESITNDDEALVRYKEKFIEFKNNLGKKDMENIQEKEVGMTYKNYL